MYLGFLGVVVVLIWLLMIMLVMISLKMEKNVEDNSVYECGFEPLAVARMGFSYRFFLLSILFLIFDVEISLMLPIPYLMTGVVSVFSFVGFMGVILAGTVYEYNYGSLEWV